MTEHDDHLTHFLAPLAAMQPARLRPSPEPRRRHRRVALAAALAIFAAVAAGAGYGYHQLTYESVAPTAPGQPFACAGLVGETAATVDRYLTQRGYRVEWRLTEYEPARGLAAAGYTHRPDSVAAGAIVEGLAWGDAEKTVIVFVRGPGDPNAPPLEPETCPQRSSGADR